MQALVRHYGVLVSVQHPGSTKCIVAIKHPALPGTGHSRVLDGTAAVRPSVVMSIGMFVVALWELQS